VQLILTGNSQKPGHHSVVLDSTSHGKTGHRVANASPVKAEMASPAFLTEVILCEQGNPDQLDSGVW
jgi:hypothetical protein